MPQGAFIFGCEGEELTNWEKSFFRDSNPWGFILFARNIDNPDQLKRLTGELREALGRDALIMIDQEGGRVQRMRAPHWREYPPALDQMNTVAIQHQMRAMYLRNFLIASELRAVGIDTNCAPLADLVEPETHPVLRNRLYGLDVQLVVKTAMAAAEGMMAAGVLPILKHIPGYGRASVDGHLDLPVVNVPRDALQARDFAPFRALRDLPMGMTAHIVFSDIDPGAPATTSPIMMEVIRNDIGFDHLIMTDDISMEALSGDVAERSRAAIAAGCDIILHCNGEATDMQAVAQAAGTLGPQAQSRANHALLARTTADNIDIGAAAAEFAGYLKG